jgi:hypothetical protein
VIDEPADDVLVLARAWLKAHAPDHSHDRIPGRFFESMLCGASVTVDSEIEQALQSRPISAADQALTKLVDTAPELAWRVVLEAVALAPSVHTFAPIASVVGRLVRAQPELFIARLGAQLAEDSRWLDTVRIVAAISAVSGLSDEARQQLVLLAGTR